MTEFVSMYVPAGLLRPEDMYLSYRTKDAKCLMIDISKEFQLAGMYGMTVIGREYKYPSWYLDNMYTKQCIGDTHCCGSAMVYCPSMLTAEKIQAVIRKTRVGIMDIYYCVNTPRYSYDKGVEKWNTIDSWTEIEKRFNDEMKGLCQLVLIDDSKDYRRLVSIEVSDEAKFKKWIDS